MKPTAVARVDVAIWVLIYAGLLLVGFGLALLRGGRAVGWFVATAGVAAVAAGVVLVWLRSRTDGAGTAR